MANPPSPLVVFLFLLLLLRACSCSGSAPFENSLGYLRRQRAPPALQLAAAWGVLGRLLPNHSSSFEFAIISEDQCGGKDCFLLNNIDSEGHDSEISISGSSGVDILAGLHWYLKYWCGGHVSWKKTGGSQLDTVPVPGTLPRVHDVGVRVQRPVPWSYYQNVVTASYSSVWWDWKRWEEEIDWMALQGINLPLAFTGQETIWVKVFEKFNLTKADLNDFFGGPAFLAWARMGNLHAWGGPLPQSWLDEQLTLQKRILTRMFQLGMTPVLPAFSGNVPAALQSIFPSANITQLGEWNTVNGDKRWCCTYLLDPNDELFISIGKAFVLEQIKEYGWTSHIYNCDTFNENEPPSNDTSYISSLGAGVYEAMIAGDDEAIWLMQGWLFSSDSSFWQPPQMQALLHSVPVGKMVVLDLFAEVQPIWQSSNHFYGVPYIWCMLHNFGGNIEMYGTLDTVGSGPIQAKNSPNSTMVGVGMCMEGIEQNPVVYELMAEMAFRTEAVNVEEWINSYTFRRYGRTTGGAQKAWQTLHQTIYNCTDGIADHNTDVIVKLPDLDPTTFKLDKMPGHLWYSNEAVGGALQDLLNDSYELAYKSTYRYDLTDLTRQFLANQANQIYYDMILAYQSGDCKRSTERSKLFIELISDMEVLLASNECFLLGDWLESAKALAIDQNQLQRYEWNARTQVTMWFDNTDDTPSPLRDYANHYLSGLVGDYYLPRAALYTKLLSHSMDNNVPFPFGQWREQWIVLTNSWQASNNSYPTWATGDSVQIAAVLSKKYTNFIQVYPVHVESCAEI